MIKQTVTYIDFNGVEQTETLRFHFTRAEIVELEKSRKGGLSKALEDLSEDPDTRNEGLIIEHFKRFILGAYGEMTPDGGRFVKSETIRDSFQASEAYSTLFMKLVTETGAAIEFFNGLLPEDFVENPTGTKPLTPREQSEARMQGFNKAKAPQTSVVREPEPAEVVIENTAPPALPQQPEVAPQPDVFPASTPETETREQTKARLWAQLQELEG